MKKSKNYKDYYVISNKKSLIKFLEMFYDNSYEVYRKTLDTAVEDLYQYILSVLDKQSYKWQPLNPDYKARKEKKGLSGKMLIATGDYYHAIEYKITDTSITVGVPNAIHEPSGLNYGVLARIHEFGVISRNIPARPLFRPAISWWIREWNSKYKNNFIAESKKTLMKKMPNVI